MDPLTILIVVASIIMAIMTVRIALAAIVAGAMSATAFALTSKAEGIVGTLFTLFLVVAASLSAWITVILWRLL